MKMISDLKETHSMEIFTIENELAEATLKNIKWSKTVVELKKQEDLFFHLKHFEKALVVQAERI